MDVARPRADRRPPGPVEICDALSQQVPRDEVARAIAQLRSAGADCWACTKRIRPHERSALQLHVTSVAGRLGFTHARCAASGVVDDRRSRRAALHAQQRLTERATDVLAFLAFRSFPTPRSVVVLSPQSPVRYLFEQGAVSYLMEGALTMGMEPVAPPVIDCVPVSDARWSVRQPTSGRLLVECESAAFYDGEVSDLPPWSKAATEDGTAAVLFAGIGLRSSVAGDKTWNILDRLADQGQVVGVAAIVLP